MGRLRNLFGMREEMRITSQSDAAPLYCKEICAVNDQRLIDVVYSSHTWKNRSDAENVVR